MTIDPTLKNMMPIQKNAVIGSCDDGKTLITSPSSGYLIFPKIGTHTPAQAKSKEVGNVIQKISIIPGHLT